MGVQKELIKTLTGVSVGVIGNILKPYFSELLGLKEEADKWRKANGGWNCKIHTAFEGPLEVWNDCSKSCTWGKKERPNYEESRM